MNVKERIAYVRGLIEGAGRSEEMVPSKTVWEHLLIACDQLADSVVELEDAHTEMVRIVHGIDADLSDIEEDLYGEEDEGDDEDLFFIEDDHPEDEDLTFIICRGCGEQVFFEEEYLHDENIELSCPECGQVIGLEEVNGRIPAEDGSPMHS